MNQNNFKPLFTIFLLFASLSTTFSQEAKDTVYFDEDFSICEKPVAEYYRVCTLNKSDKIFYKGTVEDRFIDGRLKMTGSYTDNGLKEGEFVFYNNNGTICKRGNYINNEMAGNWYFNDSNGNAKAIFKCKSSADITPVFLINIDNDTLLKNGNGKFILNTQKDFPFIFSSETNYVVEGKVADSLKTGVYNFGVYIGNNKVVSTEKYEKGTLKGQTGGILSLSAKILNAEDENLAKIEAFRSSNIVFGENPAGLQKLQNFLLYNLPPTILAHANTFSDNTKTCFRMIRYVLGRIHYAAFPETLRNAVSEAHVIEVNNAPVNSNLPGTYLIYKTIAASASVPREINGGMQVTVDTSGEISQVNFNADLTQKEVNELKYYLQRIVHLQPFVNNSNQKQDAIINLRLYTYADTVAKERLRYRYVVYNADSIPDITAHIDKIRSENSVDIEAKFPGGMNAWLKYLERNLNSRVAADHGAPNGDYVVTISFMVDESGNVSDIRVEKDPGYGTAEEAVRIMKKGPRWQPAIKNGRNVPYRQKQNLVFQVSEQ